MKLAAGTFRLVLLATALLFGPSAWACGYHDPASINRGILNWIYPNALYVTSAVWRAQLDGQLSRDDRPLATKKLLGYGSAVKQLSRLRDGLWRVRDGNGDPAIALLMIEPMLWTRFEPAHTGLDMKPDAGGPASNDVVIITDEPVVKALVDGRVTPRAARELGLIRIYGVASAVQNVTAWLDRLSQPALEEAVKPNG